MFADESVVQGSTLRALRISHIISSDLNTLVPVLPTSILDFLKEDRPRSSVRQHKDRDKTCCWTWTKMCIRNTWFMWSTTTPLWWTETWEQGNCYETKQLQQLKTIELSGACNQACFKVIAASLWRESSKMLTLSNTYESQPWAGFPFHRCLLCIFPKHMVLSPCAAFNEYSQKLQT